MTTTRVQVVGAGAFVPTRKVSTERIARAIPGWPAERIVEKTGVTERRFLWDFDARVVDGFFVHGARNVVLALSWVSSFFDQYVVDGLVNGVAGMLQAGYRGLRRAQTGRVQNYAFVMGGGFLLLVAAYLIWR